jgi:hypothetical protein
MVDTKPLQTNLRGPSKAKKKVKQPNSTRKSSNKTQRSTARR